MVRQAACHGRRADLAGAGAGAIGAYIGGVIGDNTSYTLLLTIYALMFVFSIISLSQIKLTERELAT